MDLNFSREKKVERLYEDENYLIVNKPFDMYINSNDQNEKNTVACHVASHDSHLSTSNQPIHFVQRLDYSTSGVLCLAKNKHAASRAGKLFEKRLTRKYYLAVVRRHLEHDVVDVMYNVGVHPSPSSSHKMLAQTTSQQMCLEPKSAQSRLMVLETGRYCGEPACVVLIKPVTGRRHQLRVHCDVIGHTILGDYTYSNSTDTSPHRMFLHAMRLVLPFETDTLDVQTDEPFLSDPEFYSTWSSENIYHRFRSKQDFITACDVIDRDIEEGIKYKEYCMKE